MTQKLTVIVAKYTENLRSPLITGGHFMVTQGSSGVEQRLNSGTIASFDLACRLYLTRHDAGIGLLINDIGLTCEGTCPPKPMADIRTDFKLNTTYSRLLARHGIDQNKLEIQWEKKVRNRARPMLQRCTRDTTQLGNSRYIPNPYFGRILLTHLQDDGREIPACPLIMGTYAAEAQKRGYKSLVSIWYVGNDNPNIPNFWAIEKGTPVAQLLGVDIPIINIYISEDSVRVTKPSIA